MVGFPPAHGVDTADDAAAALDIIRRRVETLWLRNVRYPGDQDWQDLYDIGRACGALGAAIKALRDGESERYQTSLRRKRS